MTGRQRKTTTEIVTSATPAVARTSGSATGRSRAASARPRRRSARRSRGGASIPASHAPVRKMPVPRTQSTGPKSPRASAYGPNMAAIGRKGMTSSRTPTARNPASPRRVVVTTGRSHAPAITLAIVLSVETRRRCRKHLTGVTAPPFGPRLLASLEGEERRAVLHGGAVLGKDAANQAPYLGGDLVHHLHRLDDAQDLARLDQRADLDERRGIRPRPPGEGPPHGRGDDDLAPPGILVRHPAAQRRFGAAAVVAHEADLAAAILYLELEDAMDPHHADELADLGDVHARGPGPVYSKAGRPRKPNRATRVSRRRRKIGRASCRERCRSRWSPY